MNNLDSDKQMRKFDRYINKVRRRDLRRSRRIGSFLMVSWSGLGLFYMFNPNPFGTMLLTIMLVFHLYLVYFKWLGVDNG